MPTAIPDPQKACFIQSIQVFDAKEAAAITPLLVNFEDLPIIIARLMGYFQCYPQLAVNIFSCFSSYISDLNTVGIYYAQTLGATPIVNPKIVINSTTDELDISGDGANRFGGLAIIGTSIIKKILLSTGAIVSNLFIGPGAIVNILDGTASNAIVRNITLASCRSNVATLNMVLIGSVFNNIIVEAGSYFGGVKKDDPLSTCATPVTDAAATNVTGNSVQLGWTNPGTWASLIIRYRRSSASDWILADTTNGIFLGDTGFIFNKLESCTYYDFGITVVCVNGGQSTESIVSQKTSDC